MIMKDSKYRIGLAALSLALTQCAAVQEIEAPLPGDTPFEVYAEQVDTRTANDGMSTLWLGGDQFGLFHAPAGTATFVADGAFTIDNPATGHASGTANGLVDGSSYDWYMVYPYEASATAPTAVPVVVGAASGMAQVQTGKDSRAHLAGNAFPVGGKAAGVTCGVTPVLASAPLVSVIAVHVTNPGAASVKVTDVRFKAPEAIVGSFKVDVTGASPQFTAVTASDEAVLSVTGSSLLRAGESAVFYLGIKPFVAGAGTLLTLTVNGQERNVTLTRPVVFSAGKIKALNVTLDESEPSTQFYFKRVTEVTSGHKYILVAEDTKQGGLRMACPLPEGTSSGRMDAETVTEEDGNIIALDNTDTAFSFFQSENGYTIRQKDGRYVYNNNQDNAYVGTEPNVGYYWTVTFDEDGLASIVNRSRRIQYNPTSTVQKFQVRQVSSSVGRNPWLYELQNDEEVVEEFIQNTVPGVYDYNGVSWLNVDGTSQSSVRTLNGTVAFRIYYPADYTVVQVTGLPASPAVNDRFPVRMVRYVKQAATHAEDFSVTVLKVEGGKAWLMADGGTGFIVNIQ